MSDNDIPGVPPIVAFMLVFALLCLTILILIVASLGSRAFQRAQDRRWARQHVTRAEWLRINAGIVFRSIVDVFRRGH